MNKNIIIILPKKRKIKLFSDLINFIIIIFSSYKKYYFHYKKLLKLQINYLTCYIDENEL